jgi:hypothetical protein
MRARSLRGVQRQRCLESLWQLHSDVSCRLSCLARRRQSGIAHNTDILLWLTLLGIGTIFSRPLSPFLSYHNVPNFFVIYTTHSTKGMSGTRTRRVEGIAAAAEGQCPVHLWNVLRFCVFSFAQLARIFASVGCSFYFLLAHGTKKAWFFVLFPVPHNQIAASSSTLTCW